MAKRFTDTNKWTNNKWFFNLSIQSKLFWVYLLDACDAVGVWEENVELASRIIGYEYSIETLLNDFKKQIYVFKDGRKWWIIDFCDFQYGVLSENTTNKPHQSYISLLKKHSLFIEYSKGIHTLKEKEKEKEKETDEEKVKIISNEEIEFEKVRKLYPGTKRGFDTEFDNFKKKHKDWKTILGYLYGSLLYQIEARKKKTGFVPEWANFSTWINQRKFEEEIPQSIKENNLQNIDDKINERFANKQ